MAVRRGTLPLTFQLLLVQVAVVLVTVLAAGALAVHLQEQQIRDAYRQRVLSTARSVAALPSVVDAYDDPDPSEELAPLAELVRRSSGATFVVLTDASGVRYSHPDPAKIGGLVSTDPEPALSGVTFVGTQTGTLGESLRAKVPVRDASGQVVGAASVGVLESQLSADMREDVPVLVVWLSGAALLGTVGSLLVARSLRRRIFGLEPEEIGQLLQTREAMLHGIREGVLAVDASGRVELANDEAVRLLGLPADPTGLMAESVLDASLLPLLHVDHVVVDVAVLAGERLLVANRTTATVAGRRVAQVLTLRDRTELSTAMRELDGQRSLTSTLRAQAHEFRNQLHVVAGLVEMGRGAQAAEYIGRVVGGQPLGAAVLPGGADPEVAALLTAKAAQARERGVVLDLAGSGDLLAGPGPGPGGDDDLVTVLGNLLDNALDAVAAGGRVEVGIRAGGGGAVVVVVDDDGPGVPAARRAEVFEVGVTTKALGRPGGRGLGLALVARVAARRHGRARVTSSPLGGARVEVVLGPPVVPGRTLQATATGSR